MFIAVHVIIYHYSTQTILFTADEDVLYLVASHDNSFPVDEPYQEVEQRPHTQDTTPPIMREVRYCTVHVPCVLSITEKGFMHDFQLEY